MKFFDLDTARAKLRSNDFTSATPATFATSEKENSGGSRSSKGKSVDFGSLPTTRVAEVASIMEVTGSDSSCQNTAYARLKSTTPPSATSVISATPKPKSSGSSECSEEAYPTSDAPVHGDTLPFGELHMNAIRAGLAVRVWSVVLGEWLYWVRDDASRVRLKAKGIDPGVIYTLGELAIVVGALPADLRNMHLIKRRFGGAIFGCRHASNDPPRP